MHTNLEKQTLQAMSSKRLNHGDITSSIQFRTHGCENIIVESFLGDFELITVQQNPGQDGYFNQVRQDIQNLGPLTQRLSLIGIFTKCVSSTDDNISFNERADDKNNTYPRQGILRLYTPEKDGDIETSCRKTAATVAQFLNSKDVHVPKSGSPAKAQHERRKAARIDKYVVAQNFNVTRSPVRRKLSEELTTRSVLEIIAMTFTGVTKSWATENPDLATVFFNTPYPIRAIESLGYPRE